MRREVIWEWLGSPGLEHVGVVFEAEAITADGFVAGSLGGVPFALRYDLACGADWSFRSARIALRQDGGWRDCAIERAADGGWRVDGTPRPDLAGCAEIDIMVSPFTNSLPLGRLRLVPGEPTAVTVAYVPVPSLEVTTFRQDYTLLPPAGAQRRYRYRNLGSAFEAELSLDGDGLVGDYGDIWRRRGG
jgi:hypothetical protein